MDKKELTDKEYIRELELALIFVSDCYMKAKESVSVRETEDGKASDKYIDLFMHFPMIQGSGSFAVAKIAELRTKNCNREENKMSLSDIFERMHKSRITETEFSNKIREIANKHKHE